MVSQIEIFGSKKAQGDAKSLGVKGAHLLKIAQWGMDIPSTLIIPAEKVRKGITESDLKKIVEICLFPSLTVRVSPVVPQPGLMSAVINIGSLDLDIQECFENVLDVHYPFDLYARLIASLSQAAADIPTSRFLDIATEAFGRLEGNPDAVFLLDLLEKFEGVWAEKTGRTFPKTGLEQLYLAIKAAVESWNSPLAVAYRKKNGIPHDAGMALIVQETVCGNMSETSCVGTASTRDPRTGENKITAEIAWQTQGRVSMSGSLARIESLSKKQLKVLSRVKRELENCFKEACDFDFAFENDDEDFYILKSNPLRQTAEAMLTTAAGLVQDKIISPQEAVNRIKPQTVEKLLSPQCDPQADNEEICKGFAAAPGAAWGYPVFSAEEVLLNPDRPVILVRVETEASDVGAMSKCAGVLTSSGGMTSHAAVVARAMGIPCVVGAADIRIDAKNKRIVLADGRVIVAPVSSPAESGLRKKSMAMESGLPGGPIPAGGDTGATGDTGTLTVDGSSGKVYLGKAPIVIGKLPPAFSQILKWAKDLAKVKMLANADTPADAKAAMRWGAEGIGLCRTEHMFFDPSRIDSMRRMILAGSVEEREKSLAALFPLQRDDFVELFTIMKGLPVTVRLLDPPLNEFLPKMGLKRELQERADRLAEANPMLGHRGCRLYITYPEIARMQVRAILSAACRVKGAKPRILIPLVMDARELAILRELTARTAQEVFAEEGKRVTYEFGTMIETPRAALLAGELAGQCDFMSFGTNDLTQMTLGISRDDAGKFLGAYVEKGLLKADPFETVDADGVGMLMRHAIDAARKARPGMPIGVCGEHAGDPASIEVFKRMKLDYLSCSPRRLPVAQIAAGQ